MLNQIALAFAVFAVSACSTARESRPTFAQALSLDVLARVKALHDEELIKWLASTDFDEGTIDALQCRLGSCISCFHAREFRPIRVRDQQWVDAWSPFCMKADACADAVPASRARQELALATTMAPKDPVDACEHFRIAQRTADCRANPDLEQDLAAFTRDFPRACFRADLFAQDPQVVAARARLAHAKTEAEKEPLRSLLNQKRIEYRQR